MGVVGYWKVSAAAKGVGGGEELLKWSNGRGVRRWVWERGVRCAHGMLGKREWGVVAMSSEIKSRIAPPSSSRVVSGNSRRGRRRRRRTN